jgi:hypothetical protein
MGICAAYERIIESLEAKLGRIMRTERGYEKYRHPLCPSLEGATNLGIQLGVEEIVIRIGEAKRRSKQSICSRTFGGIAINC